ncbi:MAG: DNA polymerase III subunit beta [Gemmatimonadales bacterium]|nr:MAG: DNA polymerase III subunit beta [Gemmatimonadales bacterium]
MNFQITRQNLVQGLASVSASIPSKTTLPVLSNILFEAAPDGVRMSATDLDVGVRVQVPADVSSGGSLTAPGKKLQEIAKELPDQPVQITTRGDQIELVCGRSRFKLNGLPADDFPALPSVSFDGGWVAEGANLLSLIQHTSFAVSTEESRPVLNGVLWELRDGEMRMVATNGHRLARMRIPAGPSVETTAQLIVPPAALDQVRRLFKGDETIRVGREGNHLGFRSESIEVYTRLIEGTYPNYEQVIPKDNDKHAIMERRSLESAIRRVAAVASDQTHRIRMEFSENRVVFNVLTPDLGEAHDEIEIGYEYDPIAIGFNANYLLEVLRYVGSDEVKMSFKAPERAATVEPVGAEGETVDDYLCLVMPLRLVD